MCMKCVRAEQRALDGIPQPWEDTLTIDLRVDFEGFKRAMRNLRENVGIANAQAAGYGATIAGQYGMQGHRSARVSLVDEVADPEAPTLAELDRAQDITRHFRA